MDVLLHAAQRGRCQLVLCFGDGQLVALLKDHGNEPTQDQDQQP